MILRRHVDNRMKNPDVVKPIEEVIDSDEIPAGGEVVDGEKDPGEDITPDNPENPEKSEDPEHDEKPLENMSIEELKVYAESNKINLGRCTTQEGILKKIQEANKTE